MYFIDRGMEPHGQSPWYLHYIPSYAPSTNALRYARTTASEGYPSVAKSAEAALPRLRIAQIRITHSSTGRARGLLRRRINQPLSSEKWADSQRDAMAR